MELRQLIGRKLLSPVMTSNGLLLLNADMIIQEEHLEKLANFNIDISELRLEALPSEIAGGEEAAAGLVRSEEKVPSHVTKLMSGAQEHLQEVFEYIRKGDKVPIDFIESAIMPSIEQVSQESNIYQILTKLKEQRHFLYRHSLGVSILATHLAHWLNMGESETRLIATAGLMYDIGVSQLPSDLIYKRDKFQPHEYEIVKIHTYKGYELLKNSSNVDPRIALIALQHHEREDGSGYPNGLASAQIDRYAKMIGIVDVFLAMTTDRPHREAIPFYKVIEYLQNETPRKFCYEIMFVFLKHMMESQIGKEVVLSDGRTAKIVLVHHDRPGQPLVMTGDGQVVDLRTAGDIKIRTIVG